MQDDDNLIQSFKSINILFIALGAGMLLTSIVMVYMVQVGAVVNPDLSDVLEIVVPVLGASGFVAGKFMYGMNAKKSKEETDPYVKINNYRIACLIVWVLMEGPGLFASISYFLTGDRIFLLFFSMIFMGYYFNKPSIAKFQQDF